ncbi:MAG TPA: D-glycerate dehydrogenase [Bacillota bacterium]|nr:D-glycerate dehydrogenase [Bacillota bacterium]
MRVYLTRRLPGEAERRLDHAASVDIWPEPVPPSREELIRGLAEADGLLCLLTDPIDAALLEMAPRLRVISVMAVGYNNVDVKAATRRGILVTHTPGVLTETTADLAFALILAVARRIVESDRFTRSGNWRTWDPSLLLGRDVHGAVLGLVGFGRIAQAVAQRARGFKMRLLYHDTQRMPAEETSLGAEFTPLEELLARSDFVSLHVPLTPATRGMIGEAEFSRMRPDACLINTARGEVVDESALYQALVSGRLAGAGLDVYEQEPVDPAHPLLTLDNVIALPHVGSATRATRKRMADLAVDNLLAGLAGIRPPHPVNPEVLGG